MDRHRRIHRQIDTDKYIDRQQDDLISFVLFFQNKEIRLKMCYFSNVKLI
jgi:hypothetical protein